jgi:DNA-binding NarL/FixJ family response regulator
MPPVGVLAVDHQEPSLRAARTVVSATPGFVWLAEARSAEEALEAAMALRPGLALVAIAMPGIDGRETARRLTAALPETVVALTAADGAHGLDLDAADRACGAAALLDQRQLKPSALRALWASHGAA